MNIRSIRAGFNVLLLAAVLAPAALAHPMGNFSYNQYSFFEFQRDKIVLNYWIDFAEIPTFAELTYLDADENKIITDPEIIHYLDVRQKEFLQNLFMDISDVPVRFVLTKRKLTLPDPTSPTLIVSASLEVDLTSLRVGPKNQAHYIDQNFPDKSGWKQIKVAAGPGVAITHDSVQERLSHLNLFNVPAVEYMIDREVYWEFNIDQPPAFNEQWVVPATAPVTLLAGETIYQPTNLDPLTGQPVVASAVESRAPQQPFEKRSWSSDKLVELIKTPARSGAFILIALAAAFVFGAAHAFEPGHGKTVVAAYLIGARGTVRDAIMLGLIVTITHTGSVFLMWAGIYFLREIFPEQTVFKWIEILSGFIILMLGIWLVFYRWYNPVGRPAHAHDHDHHDHEHAHSHGGPLHKHGPGGHTHVHGPDVSYTQLLVLGITGGIVPCPGAIVVLLLAMNQGLFIFGFSLILSFSIGLALVLMSIGIMMVKAKSFLDRHHVGEGPFTQRILPVLSAVLITILGFLLTLSPLMRYGYVTINP